MVRLPSDSLASTHNSVRRERQTVNILGSISLYAHCFGRHGCWQYDRPRVSAKILRRVGGGPPPARRSTFARQAP